MIDKFVYTAVLSFCISAIQHVAAAIPEQCLQMPNRIQACPHMLYKKSPVTIAAINVKEGGVVCLCLTDLNRLIETDISAVDKINQHVDLLKFTEQFSLQKSDILMLIEE